MNLPGIRTGTTTATEDPGPDPDSVADLPGFSPPRAPMPGPAYPDPPGPQTAPAADGGAGSPSTGTSIPAFFKERSKTYAKIAEALLMAAGGWLNKASGEEDAEAFLPDDDDTETIPPPLGRLAARRVKIGADPAALTDLEDIGMAAVGIIAWLAKGVTAMLAARRERRRLEAGNAVHSETGEGQ